MHSKWRCKFRLFML